jgi:hypothetical protein
MVQVTIDFEPFKPINTSLYLCDNKFHVEALKELLETDDKFGFIIMDGNGCLFANLAGNTREILHKMSVELPKKHGRGGQSALRFARLRLEKRHNYVTKVAEMCAQVHFPAHFGRSPLRYGQIIFRICVGRYYQSGSLHSRMQCTVRYADSVPCNPTGVHHQRQGERDGSCGRWFGRVQERAC